MSIEPKFFYHDAIAGPGDIAERQHQIALLQQVLGTQQRRVAFAAAPLAAGIT